MTDQHPSILVVDDEVDTCRNLSDILTDLGYRVDTGEMTDFQAMGQPIDQVAVHCKNEVCTTSVVARDAASD